jgi:hypothetical protein
MIEIVLNRCPRGTLMSEAGCIEYAERKGSMPETLDRSDPILVQMMKEDEGKRIWAGECSHVRIVEIPRKMKWTLMNERGLEWVAAGDDYG